MNNNIIIIAKINTTLLDPFPFSLTFEVVPKEDEEGLDEDEEGFDEDDEGLDED